MQAANGLMAAKKIKMHDQKLTFIILAKIRCCDACMKLQ
jgi:hypothetical protein